jgi:hypothetical protein
VNTANVLELGSGTGFIGILVASLQLHAAMPPFDRQMPSVYLTDVNSTVLVRCQNNVRLPCSKFGDVYLLAPFESILMEYSTCRRQIFISSEYTLQVVGLAGFIVGPGTIEVVLWRSQGRHRTWGRYSMYWSRT